MPDENVWSYPCPRAWQLGDHFDRRPLALKHARRSSSRTRQRHRQQRCTATSCSSSRAQSVPSAGAQGDERRADCKSGGQGSCAK